MSSFDPDSRYVRFAKIVETTDRRGRTVRALTPAVIPAEPELGEHRRREGQRLDHLANRYLDQPTGFWRISRINDAMTPEVLADADSVKIPVKR